MSLVAVKENDGPSGSGGSKLFAVMTFFVSLKVPNRTAIVEKIKSHGGTISKLENKATFCLGDPARKDNPPGFISYQMVDNSVRMGELVDMETYQLDATAVAGVARPVKKTRTPFTAADKDALTKFMTEKIAQNAALRGNEIYKELAHQRPNHPWQSWRNLWIKELEPAWEAREKSRAAEERSKASAEATVHATSSMPSNPAIQSSSSAVQPPSSSLLAPKPAVSGPPPAVVTKTPTLNKPGSTVIPSTQRVTQSSVPPSRNRSLQNSGSFAASAPEDGSHRPLQECASSDKSIRVATQHSFPPSKDHPSYTQRKPQSVSSPSSNRHTHTSSSFTSPPAAANTTRRRDPEPASPVGGVSTRIPFTAEEDDTLTDYVLAMISQGKDQRDATIYQGFADMMGGVHSWQAWRDRWIKRLSRQSQTRKAVGPDQSKHVVETRISPPQPAAQPPQQQQQTPLPRQDVFTKTPVTKDQEEPGERSEWFEMLKAFWEETGSGLQPPMPWVKVGVRSVALWDLFQANKIHQDWESVAEHLGFDWVFTPEVTNELAALWRDHLAAFAEVWERFLDSANSEGTGDDPHDDPDDDRADAGLLPAPDAVEDERPSSRQSTSTSSVSAKRTLDKIQRTTELHVFDTPAKRRRHDRSKEIPSSQEQDAVPPPPPPPTTRPPPISGPTPVPRSPSAIPAPIPAPTASMPPPPLPAHPPSPPSPGDDLASIPSRHSVMPGVLVPEPELSYSGLMDHFLRQGYQQDAVAQAMRATGAWPRQDHKVIGKVAAVLSAGRRLPSSMRGVWSPADDEALRRHEAIEWGTACAEPEERALRVAARKNLARLEAVHGRELVQRRLTWLRRYSDL